MIIETFWGTMFMKKENFFWIMWQRWIDKIGKLNTTNECLETLTDN